MIALSPTLKDSWSQWNTHRDYNVFTLLRRWKKGDKSVQLWTHTWIKRQTHPLTEIKKSNRKVPSFYFPHTRSNQSTWILQLIPTDFPKSYQLEYRPRTYRLQGNVSKQVKIIDNCFYGQRICIYIDIVKTRNSEFVNVREWQKKI